MPLIPDHKFPRFSPVERARDTFERAERERERERRAAVEKHGDGFTFLPRIILNIMTTLLPWRGTQAARTERCVGILPVLRIGEFYP